MIHYPEVDKFNKLFEQPQILEDSSFINELGNNITSDQIFYVQLAPEPTISKSSEGRSEVVHRFLPKDFYRDYLIQKIKALALTNGFKIKMPYADRCDKHHRTRTVNFYCHMSKSANRKVATNSCPFRAIYKVNMNYLKENRDLFVAKEQICLQELVRDQI